MKTPLNSPLQGSSVKSSRKIAIVGLSGRYPGGANSPKLLWELLSSGRDGVGEANGERWDLGWHNADTDRVGRVYTKACGMLDRVDGFDAEFFGISHREAQQMDPQQRLLLELAWEAFEDAGIPPRSMAGSKTGVYVGVSSNDYAQMSGASWPDAYSNTGVSFSIAANRISYIFDLHGPSIAIDTACSSSLVCVHEACQSILTGESDVALAGGVSIISDIRPWLGFARASMLSPSGRCKSFDESGDGYVRSEGGGLVLLKPLEDAERDGDNIQGVILATGINSDGRTLGLAMPNGDMQETLLRQVYSRCDVSPEQVFYVEAHGTGTSVGDPIECGALGRVLGEPREDGSLCHIGSVKSNIGHLEPASGIAGLSKVLLSLKHGEIPANLHFSKPNPKIEFDNWNLNVVDKTLPIPASSEPVIIGVNSFGFGGTNSHIVIQQYQGPEEKPQADVAEALPKHAEFLILSANAEGALKALATEYLELLNQPEADWSSIAAATALSRSPQRMRLVIRASSAAEAATRLSTWLNDESDPNVALGSASGASVPTAFVYSGNGPQWWGMGRELLAENPVFRKTVESIDAIFSPLAGWSLMAEMALPEQESRIELTEVSQPLLFALQLGLTETLKEEGISPNAVMGHSVGEVAAAYASGALSLEQATQVIYHRSLEQANTAGMGKMAAISLNPESVEEIIEEIGGWLELAAINGAEAVTVAGDEDKLKQLVDRVTHDGQFAKILRLNYPFHTKAMDSLRDNLLAALTSLVPSATTIPFVSTVDGVEREGESLDGNYWFDNVREPVQFHNAVEYLLGQFDVSLFIEVGPHPVLKDYIGQTARSAGVSAVAIQSLRRPGKETPESDVNNLSATIATALANGASDVADMFDRPAILPELPTYPWQQEKHWRGAVALPDTFVPVKKDHPLLGAAVPATDGFWENPIQKEVHRYLADHVVQDSILFPGAAYLELCLSAARETYGEGVLDTETFQILRPLVLTDQNDPIVQTVVDALDGTTEISSRRDRDAHDFTTHVKCRLSKAENQPSPKVDLQALKSRTPIQVSAEEHYADSSFRGLDYGPFFQGIQFVQLSEPCAQRREAFAEIKLDFLAQSGLDGYLSHPSVFDSCLQAIITLIAQNDKRNVSTIPVHLEHVRSYAPLTHHVLCHVTIVRESSRSAVADFDIMNLEGDVLLSVKAARCQKTNLTGATISPLTSEWWRPDANYSTSQGLRDLPAPDALLAAVQAKLDEGNYLSVNQNNAQDSMQQLNQLASLYAFEALDALRPEGDSFDIASISRHARIGRKQTPLLKQLIEIAESAGHIQAAGKGWQWQHNDFSTSSAQLWAELFRSNPALQAELMLLAHEGESLVAQLIGEEVSAPNPALLEQLADTGPVNTPANNLALIAIEALMADWPSNRPVRILELCGATGGMSSWVLPVLPAERTDYLFTDASEAMIGRAERRLASHRFVRCQVLDGALSHDENDLPTGYFDIVLASAQGSKDKGLSHLLENLKPALAPGAIIISLSPPKGAFGQLIMGTHQGVTAEDLSATGFENTAEITCRLGGYDAAMVLAQHGQAVHSPVSTEYENQSYLIVGEENSFAKTLTESLLAQGQTASYCGLPAMDKDADKSSARDFLKAQLDEMLLLIKPDHVIWLNAQAAGQDLFDTQANRCLSVVALVEEMEKARQHFMCDLTVVTRGAFPDCNGNPPLDPAEAAMYGFARVIGNEHSGLDVRMIDLYAKEEGEAQANCLASELLRRDSETEVQLADGHRYVNRERINTTTDEARHAGLSAEAFTVDFIPQGGLDSLYLRELSRKQPDANEVEIAVKAAGLNFRDVLWCMGMLPEEAVEHGFSGPTIGMECAGEIIRVGANITHLAPGDKVVAFASSCFGSHVTTDAKSVEKMPEGLNFSEAATIPTTFLTAWYGLDYLARIEPGETVLIHGAAGGVGLAAVQIAKLKGAKIIGTAGSAQKRRMLELLGVHHVLNSRTLEFADDVMALTDGVGVDVVLNSLAGEAITKSLQCLRPFGRFLEIGKRDLYANNRIGLRPFRNNLSYFGIDADTLLIERPQLGKRLFAEVIEQFRTGKLYPLPHQVVPVSRAAEAFRAMQQSRHVGKLVVSMELDRLASLPVVPHENKIRSDATYLVTGGLGGFGLQTAQWLAEQGATSLALVSRSGASKEEAQQGIAKLEAKGVTVRAFAADIADPEAVNTVLTSLRAEMLPLTGVIHSAAVIEDAPILSIEAEQLSRVFLAKMVGAKNLHEATLNDPISMFVLYSSSAAVVGNPGQGAYVAANLYLDALAMARHSMGLPGLAVGWGAIKDAGFLTRHEEVRDMLKNRTGLDATPAREALEDLGRVYSAGASRVSVGRFDLQRLHQMLPAARVPRFLSIVPSDASALLSAEETLEDLLETMPKSERRAFILQRIQESSARVLGTSVSQVNAEMPLSELGLDSLMAVELAGIIERDIGQSVPVMQLISAESLSAVAEFVAQALGVASDGTITMK